MTASPDPLALLLGAAALVASRLRELHVSTRNERALRARGARPVRGDLFPAFAALHAAVIVAIPVEAFLLRARVSAWWPLWLGAWIGAECLRVASMHALGDRWTVRVFSIPGEARVRRGPYRFIPHPSYLAASIELVAVPLLFGATRTALLATIVNSLLLARRIRVEDAALDADARPPGDAPALDLTARAEPR